MEMVQTDTMFSEEILLPDQMAGLNADLHVLFYISIIF